MKGREGSTKGVAKKLSKDVVFGWSTDDPGKIEGRRRRDDRE